MMRFRLQQNSGGMPSVFDGRGELVRSTPFADSGRDTLHPSHPSMSISTQSDFRLQVTSKDSDF